MFEVKVFQDFVGLYDGEEELAYWDAREWHEWPALLPGIVNAVNIGHTQGADAVRALLKEGELRP